MANQSIDGPSHMSMGRYERLPNKAVAIIDGDGLSCLESNKCSQIFKASWYTTKMGV